MKQCYYEKSEQKLHLKSLNIRTFIKMHMNLVREFRN